MSSSRIQSLPEYRPLLSPTISIPQRIYHTVVLESLNTSLIHIKKEGSLTLLGFFRNGWQERQTLTIKLEGEHASVKLIFFILGSEMQTFPFDLRIIQSARSTRVESHIRSMLKDRATLDATGTIHMQKNASKSSAFFSANTLLRSDDAKAKVVPSLEILTDNIQARHAATIGKLNEGQIFYLESRGLTRDEASLLLMSAFMTGDIEKISHETIRQAVSVDVNTALIEAVS